MIHVWKMLFNTQNIHRYIIWMRHHLKIKIKNHKKGLLNTCVWNVYTIYTTYVNCLIYRKWVLFLKKIILWKILDDQYGWGAIKLIMHNATTLSVYYILNCFLCIFFLLLLQKNSIVNITAVCTLLLSNDVMTGSSS